MIYSNSRDYDKAAAKRAEWQSYGSQVEAVRVDTPRAAAEKEAKLAACLAYLAARRGGMCIDDAIDAADECAARDMDVDGYETVDGMFDLIEKQCREKFAVKR